MEETMSQGQGERSPEYALVFHGFRNRCWDVRTYVRIMCLGFIFCPSAPQLCPLMASGVNGQLSLEPHAACLVAEDKSR